MIKEVVSASCANFGKGLVSIALAGGLVLSASAAPITFGTVQSIGTDLSSLTSQTGTVVQAFDFGNTTDSTVDLGGGNQIDFVAADSSDFTSLVGDGGVANTAFNTQAASALLPADFRNVLGTATIAFAGVASTGAASLSYTLTGLTIGRTYSVQLFALDNRTSPDFASRTQTYTGVPDGGTSDPVTHGSGGAFVVGTFTADAATQVIDVNGVLGVAGGTTRRGAILNALVLRDTTVPEIDTASGTLPLCLVGLCVALASGRRRKDGVV